MNKKFFNPLLERYLGPEELESFKEKIQIVDLFNRLADEPKAEIKTESSSNYQQLTNKLKLEKVLVGAYGKQTFKALVDLNERVCVPLIYNYH